MNIYINGRFMTRTVTGVERFAHETITGLHKLLVANNGNVRDNLQVTIVAPKHTPRPDNYPLFNFIAAGSLSGHLWEQISLPALTPSDAILVNLCNTAPLLRERQIAVLHDAATVAAPAGYSWAFKTWYAVMMGQLMARSRVVATVSEFSKNELTRFFKRELGPVQVWPEGAEHLSRIRVNPAVQAKYGLGARPFVLAVSSLQPNKNFKLLVDAVSLMETPPFDVVIAGGSGHSAFAASGQKQPEFVKQLGFVPDEDLAGLYQHAACFVFPSKYEGFGLPPVEAMAWGCPVLCSDAASLPEVCGDAALYFNPDDAPALQALLNRVMNNAALRDTMRQRGVARAATMSWNQTARALLSASVEIFSEKM